MNLLWMVFLLVSQALAGSADEYQIGDGDVLAIVVHGHNFGPDTFPVSSTGEVSFPYVGKVALTGMTTYEAQEAMRTALLDGYLVDPQVSVRIAEYRSKPIEILGAVEKPGVYYLQGPTSVRSMLSEAGGIQTSTGQIVVTPKSGEALLILREDLEGPLGEHQLAGGDVVRVDEGRLVFVAGDGVAKPAAIPFIEGITVMEAVVSAGGQSAVARLSGAYILRDGEKIQVNLRQVMKGKDADVALEPGDRIVIPESPI